MARVDTHNTARYWTDRGLPGLSLLRADLTTHQFETHFHDALVVAVTEAGAAEIGTHGAWESADTSTLFVFNPAEPHSGRMGHSQRWQYRSFYLGPEAMEALAAGLGTHVPYFPTSAIADPELIGCFVALHRTLEHSSDELAGLEQLYSTFGSLFQRHGSGQRHVDRPPSERALAARAVEYMHATYETPLKLADIAAVADLTPFQLITLFKHSFGLTPHAYLTQVRVNAACQLLRQGRPIADVAQAVGFCDQSALNKHFKRSYGITPLQFVAAVGTPAQSD